MNRDEAESSVLRLETGGFIPGSDGRPAYSLRAPISPSLPVLITVPHAGREYPPAVLEMMRDPAWARLRLEDRLIDEVAIRVAEATGATLITAHAPRAMLDLNRARDDVDWDMVSGPKLRPVRHSQSNRRARNGLGLVPRRLPGFGEIWRGKLAASELDQRIDGIHRPYHSATARELERIRDGWGAALLIDLHSMPPLRRLEGQMEPAQFVIGDRFGTSCDAVLAQTCFQYLKDSGKEVAHNRPYAGGFVLDTHAAPVFGLHALQLEVCRSIYLDERLEQSTGGILPLASMLAGLVDELGRLTARMGRSCQIQQAAE